MTKEMSILLYLVDVLTDAAAAAAAAAATIKID